MKITGNTVFIPGATSGIGLAMAVALSEKGNTVVVGGRRTEKLAEIVRDHPGIGTVEIDTADPASISTAVAQVLADHPDLNVLVAMAGVMKAEDWHDPASFVDSAEQIVTTNVLGPIRLIGALVEHLQAQPEATIMTVSSGLAFVPLQATPSYCASKAAIHQLSEAIRLQLADTSVQVMELAPPAVRTALMPGQEDSDFAMPLDDYVSEVMGLLETQPDAHEILVENVKFLRNAEAEGKYAETLAMLNSADPH